MLLKKSSSHSVMVDPIEQRLQSWFKRLGYWLRNWLFPIPFDSVQIEESVLNDICKLARGAAPKEMIAFLTGSIEKVGKNRVLFVDGLYVKGYYASTNHAWFTLHDLPMVGFMAQSIVIRRRDNRPSKADRFLFSNYGWFHMIIGTPYTKQAIAIYNKSGERLPTRL
jgi:proteasome lid subunit RPN8/RPN11